MKNRTDKKQAAGRVLVTGGAGYVGTALVQLLLEKGYKVNVLDTFWFWDSTDEFLKAINADNNPNITLIKGDLRNKEDVIKALEGVDSVIHLACVSNDPSADLDPKFTHSVNYEGCLNMIDLSKEKGVKRFIYASSSSVYGIKKEPNVTEELETEPITQYSKLKVEVEHYLMHRLDDNFKGVIIRPSTVSGYSPRLRLDLVVNILTNSAVNKGLIKVFGGDQFRPLIHIQDMIRLYEMLLIVPIDKINRKTFNAGYGNLKVIEIANLVKEVVGDVPLEVLPTDDPRSYHVNSDKIKNELGFEPEHTIKDAVVDLKQAFDSGKVKNINDDKYYNIKRMKKILAK
jgi:nucleoside-diphosphate-sugar epimerase